MTLHHAVVRCLYLVAEGGAGETTIRWETCPQMLSTSTSGNTCYGVFPVGVLSPLPDIVLQKKCRLLLSPLGRGRNLFHRWWYHNPHQEQDPGGGEEFSHSAFPSLGGVWSSHVRVYT